MISFFDLSSAGSVVRLASDTNGLSSTRTWLARRSLVRVRRTSNAAAAGVPWQLVVTVLKGHFGLRKRGHFPALDLRLSGCEVAPHENKRDPLHPL